MVTRAYSLSIGEAEAGRSEVQDQPETLHQSLSKQKKRQKSLTFLGHAVSEDKEGAI